jgi:[ribosomal protein S5]-alanine N-acetyltransferase
MIILETTRLILREATIADAEFMLALLNSPGWLKYIGDRNVHTTAEAAAYLENGAIKSYRENGFGLYTVVEKNSQKCIGSCGIIKRPELELPDLGFAFLPDYLGKGYGYETANACIDFAKNNLKINELLAIVNPENEPSNGLLVKLGFELLKKEVVYENGTELNIYKIGI